jgi:hypothetical protein
VIAYATVVLSINAVYSDVVAPLLLTFKIYGQTTITFCILCQASQQDQWEDQRLLGEGRSRMDPQGRQGLDVVLEFIPIGEPQLVLRQAGEKIDPAL